MTYGTRALAQPPSGDSYAQLYKGIWICLTILARALSGNYVNFGVFELYGDPALKVGRPLLSSLMPLHHRHWVSQCLQKERSTPNPELWLTPSAASSDVQVRTCPVILVQRPHIPRACLASGRLSDRAEDGAGGAASRHHGLPQGTLGHTLWQARRWDIIPMQNGRDPAAARPVPFREVTRGITPSMGGSVPLGGALRPSLQPETSPELGQSCPITVSGRALALQVGRAFFHLLEVLSHNHAPVLASTDTPTFAFLVRPCAHRNTTLGTLRRQSRWHQPAVPHTKQTDSGQGAELQGA